MELIITMVKEQFDWGWIDEDYIKKNYMQNGLLTPDDYKTVTGQDYVA